MPCSCWSYWCVRTGSSEKPSDDTPVIDSVAGPWLFRTHGFGRTAARCFLAEPSDPRFFLCLYGPDLEPHDERRFVVPWTQPLSGPWGLFYSRFLRDGGT